MIYFHQHLLLISVYFFLMPAVNIASVLVPPPTSRQDQQPEYNTWSDHSDEGLAEIASGPSPEDRTVPAMSPDQEIVMELGGGSEEVILCCSKSDTDSQLTCGEST